MIDTIRVKSNILQENRIIIIHKPQNLSNNDSVQLIYCIDGESICRFQRLINERLHNSIPNLILVCIVHTDRRRDLLYVNGADKFLDFVTTELLPAIEKDYKIKNRILYGHSFGGAFTVYSMIHKPSYFNLHIASSPTPIMGLIEKENYLKIDASSKTVFYFSYGSKDMRQVRKWSNRLKDNLTGLEFDNFEWRFEILEGKNHNNSDIFALINGLRDWQNE
jgi:predicted alpha/beta superfamily hydrolase